MLIEFFYHLLALDIPWFFDLLFSNLHYLFIFVAIMFIFGSGKKVFAGTVALTLLFWVFTDVSNIFQWISFAGEFLFIYYAVKICVLAFAEDDPKLSSKLILVNEIGAYSVWIIYNLVMVG